ncbi:hypothetical protein Tco_1095805, partial [Tanacetum coccineum]
KTFEENDANKKPILNTDIGGSSYDVSGNVIVKRRCIQQPDFRQETLGQIGREVDSDPDDVHNPRLIDPTLQAVVSIGKRYRQEFRKKFDGVGSLDQFMHIPTL